jgi:hypothetical protein
LYACHKKTIRSFSCCLEANHMLYDVRGVCPHAVV